MAKIVNTLVLFSFLFGLINCQYGASPTLVRKPAKVFREQLTTTTTTESPLEFNYGFEETQFVEPEPEPVVEQKPIELPSFNYQSQLTKDSLRKSSLSKSAMQKDSISSKTTYGGSQPMFREQLPIAPVPVRTTTTTTTPVPVPTYGGSQPTFRKTNVKLETPQVMKSSVKSMAREKLMKSQTQSQSAYGSSLTISKPAREEVMVPVLPVRPIEQRPLISGPSSSYGSGSFGLTSSTKETCEENPCLNEATCLPSANGGFTCQCPWGWSGPRCEVCLTECASNPCPSHKKCRAKYGGGYDCICPGDRTGANCEIQRDACQSAPCLNGGICKPKGEFGFQCTCSTPFAGERCEKQWNNPCTAEVLRNTDVILFEYPWERTKYIICTDVNQWVSMPCSTGTFFDTELGHCVPEGFEAPACPQNFCLNGGECTTDEFGELACTCKAGFSGRNCEINIDECELYGARCGSGQCVDQINTYFCMCPNGGIGLDCTHTIKNPCTMENLEADKVYFPILSAEGDHYLQCESVDMFTVSRCASGLFWDQEDRTCSVDKPITLKGVCATAPCKHGKCVEVSATQFTCECKDGYTGDLCEEMIDFCASSPCMNGGRCLSYAGGYTCVCPDKIVDDCCCSGVINPCPEKSKLIPGVNNYYSHLFPNKYIHCDFDGRAFVRSCSAGAKWRQEFLSCLSDEFLESNATLSALIEEEKLLLTQEQSPVQEQVFEQTSYSQTLPQLTKSGLHRVSSVQTVQKELLRPSVQKTHTSYTNTISKPLPVQRPVPIVRVPTMPETQSYAALPKVQPTIQREKIIERPILRIPEAPIQRLPETQSYAALPKVETVAKPIEELEDDTFYNDETEETEELPVEEPVQQYQQTGRMMVQPLVQTQQRMLQQQLPTKNVVQQPVQRTQVVHKPMPLPSGRMVGTQRTVGVPQQQYRKL